MIKPSITPTLGSKFLTDPEEIIVYQFNLFANIPKNASSLYNTELSSLALNIKNYGMNKTGLANQCERDLVDIYRRIFPPSTIIDVNVTPEDDSQTDSIFTLIFNISVIIDTIRYHASSKVRSSPDGYVVIDSAVKM